MLSLVPLWYLRICQSSQVWIKIKLDPNGSTRQSEASDQQHDEHQIREGRCEVDHLYGRTHTDTQMLNTNMRTQTQQMSSYKLKENKQRPGVSTEVSLTNLSCGFRSLPDAEVAHDPGDEQTQGQVPVQRAHVVNARGNPQRSSPVKRQKKEH